jgi:hypothetical protein
MKKESSVHISVIGKISDEQLFNSSKFYAGISRKQPMRKFLYDDVFQHWSTS